MAMAVELKHLDLLCYLGVQKTPTSSTGACIPAGKVQQVFNSLFLGLNTGINLTQTAGVYLPASFPKLGCAQVFPL